MLNLNEIYDKPKWFQAAVKYLMKNSKGWKMVSKRLNDEEQRKNQESSIDEIKKKLNNPAGSTLGSIQPTAPVPRPQAKNKSKKEKEEEEEKPTCSNCGRPGHSATSCMNPRKR